MMDKAPTEPRHFGHITVFMQAETLELPLCHGGKRSLLELNRILICVTDNPAPVASEGIQNVRQA